MFLMFEILSSRSLAFCALASALKAGASSCLLRLLISSSAFLYASARSSYSFFAWFLESLLFASASLVLLYSRKVRFMSTVPIFRVPCARAAIGRTNKETSVKESNFFIRGLNKSSETVHTASANIRLKLVADAEVQMAMLSIPGRVNGNPVIEAQRPNRQIEANPDSEVRAEAVESAARTDDRNAISVHRRAMGDRSCNRVVATWHCESFIAKIPRVRIDQAGIVKDGPARFLDDRKTYLCRHPGQGLATDRLIEGVFGTDIAKPESTQIIGAAEIQAVVDRHGWNLLRERHRRTTGDRYAVGVGYEATCREKFCLGLIPYVHRRSLDID